MCPAVVLRVRRTLLLACWHLSRSSSFCPQRKQGAIILATGGDNSNSAMGKFYEGVMVTGVTTDATDELVQANIVAVGYKNLADPTGYRH